MFVLHAEKNLLEILNKEPVIVTGSVNIYNVQFKFSDDWDNLTRVAVFRSGEVSCSVLLEDSGKCKIPWEVLEKPYQLYVGVYGKDSNENIVLPTIWKDLGVIKEGTTLGNDAKPHTPSSWQQELNRKGDNLDYDGLTLKLKSGENVLSEVPIIAGGEGGGIAYRFGHGLKQNGLDVSIDTVDDFSGDNTLPITAAGVQKTVGNIEVLLGTI